MKLACSLVLVLFLAACGGPAETALLSGNGTCHPSQALPSHKAVAPVDESQPWDILRVFRALVDERKSHADDDRDYNTLYRECVAPATPAKAQ